jgi:lysophospholipase L1-like esterase
MTGLNNIAMDDFDFLGPYQELVQELSAAYPKARIFVNSILPTVIEFIDNRAIESSNRAIRKIADEGKAGFIYAYALFVDSSNEPIKEYFSSDGVHLSDSGYREWSGAIEKIISG